MFLTLSFEFTWLQIQRLTTAEVNQHQSSYLPNQKDFKIQNLCFTSKKANILKC
jgi:hypothetical protein